MFRKWLISVVIPCRNEEKGIIYTYSRIPKFIDEVIVVDNLSTDKTSKLAKRLGANVIYEDSKGYGFAIKKGIDMAKGDIIITIDGDGTYPIEDSGKGINYLLNRKLDFVSCSRFPLGNKKSMKWQNYLGNNILTFLMTLLFFKRFQDGLSGMWIFKKNIYGYLLPLSSSWNISEEIKIEALLHPKIKFGEFYINYHPRVGESKLWPIKVGLDNILYLFYLRFLKKRKK